MTATARPYAGADDLAAIQDAASRWEPASCRTIHPGDVAHRLYNALRHHDPTRLCRVWEDGGGLAGWAMVFPRWQSWDALAAPGRDDVLADVLDWCEATIAASAEAQPDGVQTDVSGCDERRIRTLEARGYRKGEQLYWAAGRAIDDVPEPELRDGFWFRAATGPQDAAALAEVHAGSFGSTWTPETYLRYMESPAYAPERELVVVAPDGRLAAFCVLWLDERNRSGLFEPVGTHRDFRKLGLGRSLLHEGMRRLRDWGMEEALVTYEVDNEASAGLYRSVGFEPRQDVWDYKLPLTNPDPQ